MLIAGAGPIGLTAAIELTRRGIDCRIVDPLPEPPQYAKAVGVQPRTLEAAEAAVAAADGEVNVYLIAAPGAYVATTVLPLIRDAAAEFAGAYPTDERTAFAVRPDGYLGFAGNDADLDGLTDHLHATFG